MRGYYYGRRRRERRRGEGLAKLPWHVPAAAGVFGAAFFGLVAPAVHLPGVEKNPFLRIVDHGIHHPALLHGLAWLSVLTGTLLAYQAWRLGQSRRRLLDRQRNIDGLRSMSWQQFEQLVGEFFRRQGFQVVETGQGGKDGGVDLMLRRGQERVIVQCKQWKSANVGVSVVREMFGLQNHFRVQRVKIVSCGRFTRDAWQFAQGKPIDLIDGEKLLAGVKEVQQSAN